MPVRYLEVSELGIDPATLTFEPIPPRGAEAEPAVIGAPNGEHRHAAVIPLSIAEAKRALAATFGVGVDAIEITIRG